MRGPGQTARFDVADDIRQTLFNESQNLRLHATEGVTHGSVREVHNPLLAGNAVDGQHACARDSRLSEGDELHFRIVRSCDAIAIDDGAIDVDAEAGAPGDRNEAVGLDDRLDRQMISERIFLLLEFEHRRHREQAWRLIWDRSQEVDRGCKADHRSPGVRDAFDSMDAGERGDLLAFGDAARGTDVGLYDIHRLAHNGLAKAPAREFVLAAGDRHVERPADLYIAVDVFGRNRLFKQLDVEFLELPSDPDRGGNAETMVGIDHQLDVASDRLAHRAHAVVIALDRSKTDLHLDCLEACLHIAFSLFDGLIDKPVHVGKIEPGRIGVDLGTKRAADQFMNRLAAQLTDQVPQRDIDAADRPDRHSLRPVILDPVV